MNKISLMLVYTIRLTSELLRAIIFLDYRIGEFD